MNVERIWSWCTLVCLLLAYTLYTLYYNLIIAIDTGSLPKRTSLLRICLKSTKRVTSLGWTRTGETATMLLLNTLAQIQNLSWCVVVLHAHGQ